MKQTARGVLVALLALLVVVLPAQSTQAAEDPYPDLTCDVEVGDSAVEGGSEETFTVSSDVPTDLSISFLGETRTRANATELTETFETPVVAEREVAELLVECDESVRVTDRELLPADDGLADADAGQDGLAALLPGTGGPALWILLLGLLVALTGAAFVVQRRRA